MREEWEEGSEVEVSSSGGLGVEDEEGESAM